MKLIRTEDAVGHVLCHDITQIIPGVTKDAVFRKGHIVREEDIPVLLSVGKEHLYVWEMQPGILHEDDAAEILYEICAGENTRRGKDCKEGKIELFAGCDGLFDIDLKRLNAVNSLGEMMIAARQSNFPVKAGDKLAGTRIIPLVIEQEKMDKARAAAGDRPLMRVLPWKVKKAGLITTGSEVAKGLITDKFSPVVIEKLKEFGCEVCWHETLGDDPEPITAAIRRMLADGAELICCTGGMSVDPDDKTPLAIRNSGVEIISYGAPVLPGAMFLLSYTRDTGVPVVGLPGCVMYAKRTIFDLALCRIMAGKRISAGDLAVLGNGGLCLNCPVCTYPNCGFGKSSL